MRRAALAAVACVVAAALGFTAGLMVAHAREETRRTTHVDESRLAWEGNDELPVVRWRTLVGGDGIPQPDVQFGTFELAPKAIYPGHLHPAPEVYFVLEGHVRWTVGAETFEAGPGTAVYTPPDTPHRMENLGGETVRAVWSWWAPGGDRAVFQSGYRFVEPLPQQSPDARFPAASRPGSP